ISANGALRLSSRELFEELVRCFLALSLAGERKNFRGEPWFKVAAHGAPREIAKICDHAVGGKNGEAFTARVDEGHHGEFIRRIGNKLSCTRARFVTEIERSFVTVVAIGDEQFLVGHSMLD